MALTDGIVGCWSPGLSATSFTVPDLSRRSNPSIAQNPGSGGMRSAWVWNGNSAATIFLNGNTQHFRNTKPSLVTAAGSPGNAFTVTTWFVSTGRSGAFRTIWSTGVNNPGNSPVFEFGISNGNVLYFYGRQPNFVAIGSISIALNTAYFCAVGIEAGGSGTVFAGVNGAFANVGTTSANDGQTCTDEFIGTDGTISPNDSSWFQGHIGETTSFSRLLTLSEVREIYRQGNGAIGRQLTGQARRRVYGFVPPTGARRRRILTGMV